MLQRIQTLFLFAATTACAACFCLPFWNYISMSPAYNYQLTIFSVKLVSGNIQIIDFGTLPIIFLVSVSAILSLYSMFSFKNRRLQIKLNSFNVFITIIFIGVIYILLPNMLQKALPNAESKWGFGLILPLITLVCLISANVFIKKDENLVKSADRLR